MTISVPPNTLSMTILDWYWYYYGLMIPNNTNKSHFFLKTSQLLLTNSIAFYYLLVRLLDWTFKVNSTKCRLLAFPENIRLGGKSLAYNIAPKGTICGLYNKHVLVVIDDSSVISKWNFKLIDDPRVVIYGRNMFIIRAIEGILY